MDKTVKFFFVLLFVFIIFFTLNTNLPLRQQGGFFSDEASYYSITQSLVHDFDLKYTPQDCRRILAEFPAGPVGLHLKRTPDGIYYAKSFAYPLAAAPFYAVFGVRGFLLFNGLMIFAVILMGFLLLNRYYPSSQSLTSAIIFVAASVVPAYLWWMTADLFNFFVMFAALFFFFYPFKRPAFFYLSSIFFSFAVFSKPWIITAAGIIFLILLRKKQWKRFIILSLLCLLVFGLFIIFFYSQTGELSYKLFQGGERRQFSPKVLYKDPGIRFEDGVSMSFDNYWNRIRLTPRIILNNVFYFLFGRFTGMFIYFSSAFFLLTLFFFQRKEPDDWFVFSAIVITSLVFVTLAPDNYFGGSGSIGNRYFFNIFPIFFFLGFKNRLFKFTLAPALISLVFLSGIYFDSHYHAATPRYAGLSFPINLFPPEKTQYLSLPTNENPRAFGQHIRTGASSYQLFFLNDNFHTVEGDHFWSKGSLTCELFLVAEGQPKTFEITLETKARDNRITFSIDHIARNLMLQPGRNYTIRFDHIDGLPIGTERRIYHIRIKSSRSSIGAFENPETDRDGRDLGVKTQITLTYRSNQET